MSDSAGPLLLYVEDEPLILELGLAALEEAGFSVEAVSSGALAVAAIDARGATFKALITDIDLGSDPNGWTVAKHVRERFPDTPVVYVSGGRANDWASSGVPGSVMVAKPYASAQLVVAVSTAMLPAEGRAPAAS